MKHVFGSTPRSPSKSVSRGSSQSLGSPVSSDVDSGPWYDEVATDSEPAESPRISQENFTGNISDVPISDHDATFGSFM